MRFRLTLDITRRRPDEPAPEQPPMVDAKGSFILDRREQNDYEPDHLIGFCQNDTRPTGDKA